MRLLRRLLEPMLWILAAVLGLVGVLLLCDSHFASSSSAVSL
jgi:hypothetical protein